MEARLGPRASAFLSGLVALSIHAGAWGALELAPVAAKVEPERKPSLLWLEPGILSTPQAPGDAAESAAVLAPLKPPARVASKARRAPTRACARAPEPAHDAPAETGAVAAPTMVGLTSGAPAEQPGAPEPTAAPAGAGSPGAGSAGAGAPAPRAQLLSSSPCAGFFPGSAAADMGEVQIDVAVDASGHAALSGVLLERPAGQGFAQAAKACAAKLLFAPAHDPSGAAVPVHAKLRLVFKRV